MAAVACGGQLETSARPSVLLVTIDTLRADHLGAYGYFRDTSPNLDGLAAESTVFENVITTMSTTLPAHVSLMTSTHPMTHGIKGNFAHMGEQFGLDGIRTAAEVFTQKGYATAAFVSAAPLKDHTGIQIGFGHFDQPADRDRLNAETTDLALDWLAQRAADEPFFLWVHLWDPHAPYDPMPAYDVYTTDDTLLAFMEERGIVPTERHQRWNNAYDGEIRYADEQTGRLLDALRQGGRWDETAVVVTSDHGEGLGQHGWRDHGTIHNEQLFVPLIIKWPGGQGTRPSRVSTLASSLDVMPTLFAGSGIEIDPALDAQFEGLDLLSEAPAERQYVLAERTHRERGWEDGLRYALLSEDWKYLLATSGPDRLYDMRSDRHELLDALDAQAEIGAAMAEVIELLRTTESEHAQGELPPERAEQLRALGYIQ